ncbi:hypothetical protein FA10DRAFT_288382 [Acaromyces ingoldii]|uniref:Uncharacterized protein n=1 Tax=Acaromyces ingoldii TaxID=215250 RepID=A0A316YE19_9BASI|nr:hypothetical protein FA10DRAFT_288382 [Acaromyces ingoldii]PWN87657.1 hypothetical protein FA10DRAFT_288382 [Acaromyces ingoldii]
MYAGGAPGPSPAQAAQMNLEARRTLTRFGLIALTLNLAPVLAGYAKSLFFN